MATGWPTELHTIFDYNIISWSPLMSRIKPGVSHTHRPGSDGLTCAYPAYPAQIMPLQYWPCCRGKVNAAALITCGQRLEVEGAVYLTFSRP